MVDDHLHRARAFEDAPTGEQPIGDAAQRVDVGPTVDRLGAERHFRRHEPGSAGEGPLHRERLRTPGRRATLQLHQAEIEHLDEVDVEAAQEEVGGLDVAMDEAGGVGLGQGVAGLAQQVDGALGRNGDPGPRVAFVARVAKQLLDRLGSGAGEFTEQLPPAAERRGNR